ncbi:MAG: RHS repeat-associated core domain-containing protein [Thermodesulfobacteriota bacterium]
MLGRISSCIDYLILILISVLFASNTYAQFSPTPFIDLEYFYDGVGNVDSIADYIDPQNNCTMQYDSLDRLTVADGPWGAGAFTYDSIGNRTSKDINGQNISYAYGTSDNRLSGFSYDANGNIIGDGTFTYTYDSENRLVQVTNGTDVITYGYDGDGRRISQTINGETTIFAYGVGLNVLTEFSGTGVPKLDYIYAGSRNIARINFDGAGVPVSKTFYHPDHLGSTIGLTDQETTKVWDRMYLPYGETFTGTGTTENTHQYTAKELETATGLYYYGARYHNPNIGRFMSVDPAGADPADPQSWNRYAYVQNNPLTFSDPDGEFLETAWDAFNIALGVYSLKQNLTNGNYSDALIDGGGIVIDSAAALTPFIPGGVGAAIRAGTKGSKAVGFINNAENLKVLKKPKRFADAGGFVRSFVTKEDQKFFRVFCGKNRTGGFLTKVRPRNRKLAIEGLALPPENCAEFIQEVIVPAGTRLQRSRALPVPGFGRFRGGLEQFELLDRIPEKYFGPGVFLE